MEERAGADDQNLMLLKLHLARIALALMLFSGAADALFAAGNQPLRISNRYSPLNKKRALRPHTRYIVLHTTEGGERGSLSKVIRYGETHYFVTMSGNVYRIIHKSKIATHAGRSMWEGITSIDNYSIGIEVSGYHDRDITDAQYEALRELLRQLKNLYGISDEDVITHSMVAYGRPNHFFRYNHRGRKRCGMLFAKPEVRARLGLQAAPERDIDVAEGRLKVADRELFSNLFPDKPSATYVAARAEPTTPKPAPEAAAAAPVTPAPVAVTASFAPMDPEPASAAESIEPAVMEPLSMVANIPPALSEPDSAIPSLTAASGESASEESLSKTYIISRNRTAWEVAGESYNHSSTVYILPNGSKITGDQITDWAHIPVNTRVIVGEESTQQFEGFLEVGRDGKTAKEVAGTASTSSTTIYFFPDGFIRTGAELKSRRSYQKLLHNPPENTKVLIGYVYGGYVKGQRPPSSIAGVKWNYPSTYYRYPNGSIVNGDDINDREIPAGTLVFYQR